MIADVAKTLRDMQPDVGEQRLSRLYAEALLNNAERANAVEEVAGELKALLGEVIADRAALEAFFSSGAVGRPRRADVLRRAFENRAHPLVLQFLLVLNEHDRLGLLRVIIRELDWWIDRRGRRFRCRVRTAVPMPDDQRQRLLDILRNTFKLEPILDEIVDPTILGGMVLRVGDWLFDGSIRNELNVLRKQMMETSSHAIQGGRDRFSS